jgi:hypothetical protein
MARPVNPSAAEVKKPRRAADRFGCGIIALVRLDLLDHSPLEKKEDDS